MAERKNNKKKIVKVVDIIRIAEDRKPKKSEANPEDDFFADDINPKAISELEELVRSKDEPEIFQEQEEKPKKKKKKSTKILTWTVILFLAAFFIYWAFYIAPSAIINIFTKKVDWNTQITLTVNKSINQPDVSSLQIPGEILNVPVNAALQFTPTGKKYLERKASGTATIFNAFSSAPQVLVATTRLQTPDGKIYRLVNKVTVPGAIVSGGKITPSSLPNVQIVADKAGPDYNSGAIEKLTIPGFSGTPRFQGFYASIPSGVSGGFIGNGLYPTDSDVAKAKSQIQSAIVDALSAKLLTQIPDGYTYVSSTISTSTIKVTVNTNVDSSNQFSAVGDGQEQVVVFKESDIVGVLRSLAQKNASLPQDYVEQSKTIQYQNPTVDWKLGKMTLPINYSAVYWHPIDPDQIKSAVAGKSSSDLKDYILNLPGVDKVSVSFKPFWVNGVTSDLNKINIVVQ